MSKFQLYQISVTALWAYDYLLTFKDEVTKLYDENFAEKKPTTSYRFDTHGKRRAFSVRGPSDFFFRSTPTNNGSVFVLFLFVGALHYRHDTSPTVV